MILEENKNKNKDKNKNKNKDKDKDKDKNKDKQSKLTLKKLAFICEKTSITLKRDYKLSLVTY
jgi:hypothetical protein